jgi:hypothetical protein
MIILAGQPGQLGNSLFLFAHFIAFSVEKSDPKRQSLINPSFNQYSDYFESTIGNLLCHFPRHDHTFFKSSFFKKAVYNLCFFSARTIDKLRIKNRLVKCIYINFDQTYNLQINDDNFKGRLIFIQGWEFRCPEYFKKHSDSIKDFFKLTKFHQENIDQLISPVKKKCDLLIGIHIRHGDYKTHEGGKYYYSTDQYKEIMERASALFPKRKITFLVCGNSKESLDSFSGVNIIKGTNHEVEDLYAFAKCNYLIGPPSTYTIWASFYGDVPLYQVHDPKSAFTVNDFKLVNS